MVEKDYQIINSVLEQYRGPGGDVFVPEGVTRIDDKAFEDCRSLNSIMIPEGVTSIGNWAFDGCSSLTNVAIPDSVTNIGYGAFKNCHNLTSIILPNKLTSIESDTFAGCWNLQSVTLSSNIERIETGAFFRCTNLKELSIPLGLTSIGANAFPPSVKCVFADNYLCRPIKLPAVSACAIADPRSCAFASLYQNGKSWTTAIDKYICKNETEVDSVLTVICEILSENPKEVVTKKAIEFVLRYVDLISADTFKLFYAKASELKPKNLKLLRDNTEVQKLLAGGSGSGIDDKDAKSSHPLELLVKELWVNNEMIRKLRSKIKRGVPYVDKDELSSPEAVILIVSLYAAQMDDQPKYYSMYKTSYVHTKPNKDADRLAAGLNREQLQSFLEEMTYQKGGVSEDFILAYGRYASPGQISEMIANMKKWENWGYGAKGRMSIIMARGALMLSDTREAMMAVDKVNALDYYASIRGTTEEVLRDTVLSDFGFDAEGKKKYDLGGNSVLVSLNRDLSLCLYDENAKKTVKSIPKKGTDIELYNKAKSDYADLKKNIKRVITNRKLLMFSAFLNEDQFRAVDWSKSYLGNPVLQAVASLIVWRQDEVFFVPNGKGKLIQSDGSEYLLDTDATVTIGHPMEMSGIELKAWQDYFVANKLKQPFAQIWEPVTGKETVKPDRYDGAVLPLMRFSGKEKHGIFTEGFTAYSTDFSVKFKDCALEMKASTWRLDPYSMGEYTAKLGKFSFKEYTRYTNHIVGLLDSWTVETRLLKDDVSVIDQMSGFTLAQILDCITQAASNNCPNVTAALLAYKNERFKEYGAVESLLLEE